MPLTNITPVPATAPRSGSRWKHWKGCECKVLGVGHHTETGELVVMYHELPSDLFGPDAVFFSRPLALWDDEARPGVKRFTEIKAHSEPEKIGGAVVVPYKSEEHPTWVKAYDLLGGSLILNSVPFSVELGADGVWRGHNEEVVAKAMSDGGQTWPRHLTLSLSQGRFSADASLLSMLTSKKSGDRVKAAQQAIDQGVLFPCCRLVIEGAKPGAKLTGTQLFEIQ